MNKLQDHPIMQRKLGVDTKHVIIDRTAYEAVLTFSNDRIAELELRNKLLQDRLKTIQKQHERHKKPAHKTSVGKAPTPITF